MIERTRPRTARIGVFGVGLSTYWGQFPGLLDNLMGFHARFKAMLPENVEVIDYGMIDSTDKSFSAARKMQGDGVDLIFCNMLTYATSSVFAPILREVNAPMVLVALQPLSAMDYTQAKTFMQLENDNICSVPEFTGVAIRYGRAVRDVILGTLEDEGCRRQLADWSDTACALHALKGARMGLMGHVLEAMYDMQADPTAVEAAFGLHIPLLEPGMMSDCWEKVPEELIRERSALILREFDTPDPVSDPVTTKLTERDLYLAAKASVMLDMFVEKYDLTGLAYYYESREGSEERTMLSSMIAGNSILNARGIPMCGEFDIRTCVAMLIMDRLGIGGSFAEFHPFDFNNNIILVGHDGPHHMAIADGKPVLRSLRKYHGKPGSGASVEFKIKEGPITMLSISQNAQGGMKFVIGEGESMNGPIPPTGNTNTRGWFGDDVRAFMKNWVMAGPTHHFALGVGHHAEQLRQIGEILNIETIVVK